VKLPGQSFWQPVRRLPRVRPWIFSNAYVKACSTYIKSVKPGDHILPLLGEGTRSTMSSRARLVRWERKAPWDSQCTFNSSLGYFRHDLLPSPFWLTSIESNIWICGTCRFKYSIFDVSVPQSKRIRDELWAFRHLNIIFEYSNPIARKTPTGSSPPWRISWIVFEGLREGVNGFAPSH
jgi:hypothetical protein